MFQKKTGRRWTWKSPNGVTETKTDYILTNQARHRHRRNSHQPSQLWKSPQNGYEQHQIGRRLERKTLMTTRPPRVDATQTGSKKIEFQLKLRNRFDTLIELDDIDTMSETITDMIQQSASVAKAINKPLKSRISSPTRALTTKGREIMEDGDDKQRLEYAEICKTIKKKQERTSGNTTKRL
ncbi:hypothetical protein NP493_1428g00036 [Ridgeia piscesae]|uniref:Uncharacterized protein n=1 Tax=Ridgeia piscesae TaxID=27915 RepID=A0AAD9K3D0_RIDPI|nr:hypothetical protein NP493_1428g00036 [Ridgeia piscesae]